MSTAAQQSDALPGDDFVPSAEENQALPVDESGEQKGLADAGQDNNSGVAAEGSGQQGDDQRQYDAETLALIAGDEKPTTVPHARFNEVNAARKAAEARTRELELQLARLEGKSEGATPRPAPEAPAAFDFDAAEDSYQDAILDGDKTKAKQIRAEIRAEERKTALAEAEKVADQRYKQNRDQDDAARSALQFSIELSKAYASFPFLDKDAADANADAIDETLVWVKAFQDKGKTPAEALAAAVAKIGPRYAQAAAPASAAPVKPDIQKGIERAAAVPPRATGLGARGHKVDVAKMTSEEFRNMSPEDKARFEEGV
jgi:hypothetical protein